MMGITSSVEDGNQQTDMSLKELGYTILIRIQYNSSRICSGEDLGML